MNFTKTILNGLKVWINSNLNELKVWINSNFISHNKQTLSEAQKAQAQENIGLVNATEDDIIDMLVEIDMLPAVTDKNGNILTDETGAILLM
jgi:hypothetical protein